MKGSTILIGGLAVLAIATLIVEGKSGASPLATKVDPTVGGWTIASWDVLKPFVTGPIGTMAVPAHSFVATNTLAGVLAAGLAPGVSGLGTVAAWIQAQNAAGHRVYQSDPIKDSTGATVGEIYVLDLAPTGGGYIEVTT